MSDVYTWIDPFAAIEQAREDGRREVIRHMEMDCEDEYRRLLDRELRYLADEAAREIIASMGLRKDIEKAAVEIAERATRQAVAMKFHNLQPTVTIYPREFGDKFGLDFVSGESHAMSRLT